MSVVELALLIRRFLDGSTDAWEWDDFISIRSGDPAVEQYRSMIAAVPDRRRQERAD